MPDHFSDPSGGLTVIMMPGASLMDVRQLFVDTMLVRCPGCGAAMVVTARPADSNSQITFLHEDDACPVLRRIEAVLPALDPTSGMN